MYNKMYNKVRLCTTKSSIVKHSIFHKKHAINHRYRRVQTNNALLTPIVITEYLSYKHIILSDGVTIKYVIDTMTPDQYKLLEVLSQCVIFYELKTAVFLVMLFVILFFYK
jgi:hypothetical protein